MHHEIEQPPDLGAEIVLFLHRVHRRPSRTVLRYAVNRFGYFNATASEDSHARDRMQTDTRLPVHCLRSAAGYEGWNWSTKRTAHQH